MVSRRKADRLESFLLCLHSADSGWRGQRGLSEFITEGPVPLERPEQRGYGRAICFQSRSQKNPPLPEGVAFCLLLQSVNRRTHLLAMSARPFVEDTDED